jgi:polar amino acid transport system substrate-binding protein
MKIKILFCIIAACIFLMSCTNQAVTDPEIKKIKDSGKLIVGISLPYKPMEFYDENNVLQGIDIEIAKEIASRLGVGIEFRNLAWDSFFDTVKKGDVDIGISSITITPEREEEMLFSAPYFNGGQVAIVKKGSNLTSIGESKGKVLVLKGTTMETEAKKLGLDMVAIEDTTGEANFVSQAATKLGSGEAEAAIMDYITGINMIKENPQLTLLGEPFTQEFYGIITKRGNYALMSEINRILRDMKRDGKLNQIQKKWA